MNKKAILIILIFGFLVSAYVSGFAVGGPGSALKVNSPLVYPARETPLNFSHKGHLARFKMEPKDMQQKCLRCHPKSAESQSALDNLLPREKECRDCHNIVRTKKAQGDPCERCHRSTRENKIPRIQSVFPKIKFSHREHRKRGITCLVCHQNAAQSLTSNTVTLPSMKTCMRCHDGKNASSDCVLCHLAGPGGIIKTHFLEGKFSPRLDSSLPSLAHTVGFIKEHSIAARKNSKLCSSCHKEEYCQDCHQGSMPVFSFHRPGYVQNHQVEGRRDDPRCQTCHQAQTFCVGCHSRSGVATDGRGSELLPPWMAGGARTFHPNGWVVYSSGGKALSMENGKNVDSHHSKNARINIRQCASCHRETFCTGCHSDTPGTLQANPHGQSWRGSSRCSSLLQRNKRMCLRCHTDDTSLTCN